MNEGSGPVDLHGSTIWPAPTTIAPNYTTWMPFRSTCGACGRIARKCRSRRHVTRGPADSNGRSGQVGRLTALALGARIISSCSQSTNCLVRSDADTETAQARWTGTRSSGPRHDKVATATHARPTEQAPVGARAQRARAPRSAACRMASRCGRRKASRALPATGPPHSGGPVALGARAQLGFMRRDCPLARMAQNPFGTRRFLNAMRN